MSINSPLIAIVDDDEETLRIFSRFLKSSELRVFSTPSVSNLFQVLEREKIALVLLDLLMPEIDGFSALRRLGEFSQGTKIPVIVVSAVDDPNVAAEAKALGANEYLVKPVFRRRLLQSVRRQLSAKLDQFRD